MVERSAFGFCRRLKKVTVPSSSRLKRIEDSTFYKRSALQTAELASGFTSSSIWERAFAYCESLLHLPLSPSLTKDRIGLNAFNGCEKLNMEAWDTWLCDGEYHAIPLDVKRVPVEAGVTHIPSEPLQEYTYSTMKKSQKQE
jgi:hypothetical protein